MLLTADLSRDTSAGLERHAAYNDATLQQGAALAAAGEGQSEILALLLQHLGPCSPRLLLTNAEKQHRGPLESMSRCHHYHYLATLPYFLNHRVEKCVAFSIKLHQCPVGQRGRGHDTLYWAESPPIGQQHLGLFLTCDLKLRHFFGSMV